MNTPDERALRELLRTGRRGAPAELSVDLWPRMLRRFDAQPRGLPWFDWVLVAMLVGSLPLFPSAIPLLLYHL